MTVAVETVPAGSAPAAPMRLREWEQAHFAAALSDADLDRLDRLAAHGVLSYHLTRRGFEVQAASHVGRIQLSLGLLRVEPKVSMGRLLRLLAYAMHLDDLLLLDEATAPAGMDFPGLLFAALIRGVEGVLRHGLIKAYRRLLEEPPSLRGRWLLSRDPLRPLLRPQTFLVEREELTLDVPENRVLLAALDTVCRLTRSAPQRTMARRHRSLFSQVIGLPAEPLAELGQVRLNRLNHHYGPALQAARIVLQGSALDDRDATPEVALPGFFVNMNEVFESFVGRLLAESLSPDWRVWEQEPFGGFLVHYPGGGQTIRPDLLMIEPGTGRRIVADAKYKLGLPPANADLYQLTFYLQALQDGPTSRARRPRGWPSPTFYLQALQDGPTPPGLIFMPLPPGFPADRVGLPARVVHRTRLLPDRPEPLRRELAVVGLDLDGLAGQIGADGLAAGARELIAGTVRRVLEP